MKAFITYDGLPLKAGGAHKLSGKPPKEIYASMHNFLHSYTDNKGAVEVKIELLDFSLKKVMTYSLNFGLPSFDWSNFIANGMKSVYWNVYKSKIDIYVDQIVYNHDLSLSLLWRFHFIDPLTKKILPRQSELPVLDFRLQNSQIYLTLSAAKATISLWFAFPFDNLIDENLRYIEDLQRSLPFKFSKRSWRLWNKTKNGNWTPKKISF